jgi:cullin 3
VIRQVSTRHGESETERTATTQKVEEDRRFEIEACIVRIMKSRKKIKHNQLIAELVEQVSSRFHPNLSVIKNRIETLIDRDYMERAEDDKETYLYKM